MTLHDNVDASELVQHADAGHAFASAERMSPRNTASKGMALQVAISPTMSAAMRPRVAPERESGEQPE